MNALRIFVAFIIMLLLGCAAWSSHQHKPFALWIDEAEATMIVCNPQPTPDFLRWHRSHKVNRT